MEFYLKDIINTVTGLDKDVELELTNYCNAQCCICPRKELTRPQGSMSFSTLKAFVLRCEEYKIRKISIGGMGEPLLHPEFEKCIETLSSIKNIDLSLTTNGALFNRKYQKIILNAPFSQISVSYHHLDPQSYRNFMGLKQEDCIDNLRLFAKEHKESLHKISVAIVLNKTNENEIPDICRFWRNEGIKRFIVLVAHNRGGLLENDAILDETFYSSHNIRLRHEDKTICKNASLILKFIDWQGNVHLCCNDFKGKAVMGNVSDGGLLDMEMKREKIWEALQTSLCMNCNMPSTLLETKFISFEKPRLKTII